MISHKSLKRLAPAIATTAALILVPTALFAADETQQEATTTETTTTSTEQPAQKKERARKMLDRKESRQENSKAETRSESRSESVKATPFHRGQIEQIDSANRTIVVRRNGAVTTYRIADTIRVGDRAGKSLTWRDLKVGESIDGRVVKRQGQQNDEIVMVTVTRKEESPLGRIFKSKSEKTDQMTTTTRSESKSKKSNAAPEKSDKKSQQHEHNE